GQTCWPTFQKKLISVTDAPQITAAPQETRTPTLPRPARCGLEELAPKPHTIAEMINARTDRMRPMVITAPTIVRSWAMPGRPSLLGSMLMSIGTSAGAARTVMRSNTLVSPDERTHPRGGEHGRVRQPGALFDPTSPRR